MIDCIIWATKEAAIIIENASYSGGSTANGSTLDETVLQTVVMQEENGSLEESKES